MSLKGFKRGKRSYESIEKFNKQVFLLNKLVNELKAEELLKSRQISGLQSEISGIELQMDQLRQFYARYVVAVYKGLVKDKWLYILNSGSFDEALRRYRYLKALSDKGESVIADLKSSVEKLESAKISLQFEKNEKEKIIALKEGEEISLKESIEEQKDLLADIGKNKDALKKELEAKKQSEKKIGSLIDQLIAKEELAKKNKTKKKPTPKKPEPKPKTKPEPKPGKKTDIPTKTEDKTPVLEDDEEFIGGSPVEDYEEQVVKGKSFSSLKGNLMKPVGSAKIFRPFGENKNEELKTVTVNYGIDFKVESAQSVKCVDGIISAIEWLPGYGSVVIITHTEGYRTVYGHLGSISVREGNKVAAGSVIGTVGKSLEGYIFHFEIWKGKQNLNPGGWF
ncbi:MAG: peptidoglycan DD-metalloendopeptidase family protein [Ignavibacteriales bacterium]|nr:peptidoglycan DD-metalloendopeptidase family protein [Ignavibacteriales bacterium]